MSIKKRLSIIVVPDGGKVKQFSITKITAFSLLAVIVLYIGINTVFSVEFFNERIDSHKIAELTAENDFLTQKVEVINQSINELHGELGLLADKETAIRTIFDLPEIDPAQRQLGIGGPAVLPTDELFSPNKLSAYQAEASIDRLYALSQFEKQQYFDIYDQLIEKKTDLDHTPSIMPTTGWICSGYGYRSDPFSGDRQMHSGLDISNRIGTSILATANGVVKFIGKSGRLGKTVMIDHGGGIQTIYGHLSKYEVKKGQKIMRGDLIGLMGKSGKVTGPHLHYAVKVDGRTVNPKRYIFSSDYLL